MVDRSLVSIVKNPDAHKAVWHSFQSLGGIEKFVKRGETILVKPNLSYPVPPDMGPELTHPDVIVAIVRLLKENGAGRILVGDQSVLGVRTRDTFRITGIGKAVEKAGGELCPFDEEPRILVDVPDPFFFDKLSLPKAAVEADAIINVPKMKTHFLVYVTLGLKNLLGLLTFKDRRKFHRTVDLAYVLTDIAKVLKPRLSMVDGLIAMEGFGPHGGTPRRMDVVVSGRDTVAVDAVAAAVMGFDPLEPPPTQVAAKYGLGIAELTQIDIVGEPIENVKQHLGRAILSFVSPYSNVRVFAGGVCPGCAPRIPSLPPEVDPNKKYAIVIGRRVKIPRTLEVDEIWCCGDCGVESAKAFMNHFPLNAKVEYVQGCPPLRWYAERTLTKTLRKKGLADDFTAE
jgi:uncharacterized protein (DUF362 family)